MAHWSALWADLMGAEPAFMVTQELASHAAGGRATLIPAQDAELAAAHRASRERLEAALAALDHGRIGVAPADLTIALAAIALLRGWCRWIRQFGDSSVPYLLGQFVHRAGHIALRPDALLVELEALPLDSVLQMSGYTADIERVPWLEGQRLRFLIRP
jgi:hypothetical protein